MATATQNFPGQRRPNPYMSLRTRFCRPSDAFIARRALTWTRRTVMATSGKRCRDPPFLTYIRPENGGIMSGKFSGYWSYDDMMTDYGAGIVEAQRVLKPKGVLVFKCQDTVHNHRLQLTHARICSLAEEQGFRLQDLFILVTTNRLPVRAAPHGRQVQRHARVHHSYFLVFRKR